MANPRPPRGRGMGPGGKPDFKVLSRTVKKLFSYYPVLAPLAFFCILFSAVVSSIPALFTQNVIQVIERWYLSRDWASAQGEVLHYLRILALLYLLSLLSSFLPKDDIVLK